MSTRIIPFDYDGQAVRFNADGWINATEAAARFGKRPADWLALDGTREYMEAMASALGLESKVSQNHFGLARTSRGGKVPGTWLHPKLAVRFAQWLDMKFAVWCDLQIGPAPGVRLQSATAQCATLWRSTVKHRGRRPSGTTSSTKHD